MLLPMNNLLRDPLIRIETTASVERVSLPQTFAALVADRVESFPALRAHQTPSWHMFLAQLGAIAMHRAGLAAPPADASVWLEIIQALTKDEFPGEEPWLLVVPDQTRPAFMQPPVPDGVALDGIASTPDALDLLITSKNHDLKQAVAGSAEFDDWIFAAINLQTCEGYGGSGNYGVARMNGGSSSRAMLGLAPIGTTVARSSIVTIGTRFRRDVTQLVLRRSKLLETVQVGFPPEGGHPLLWVLSWPQGAKLSLSQLDPYFIEVCRRNRLVRHGAVISACIGTSSAARTDGEAFKGAIGDPWAPVHALDNKALTIGDEGEFDYKRIVDLMFSGNWTLPLLATLGTGEENDAANWMLIAQALARGNSKTGGFKERFIPLTGRTARSLRPRAKDLHKLAQEQIAEIEAVSSLHKRAVAVIAAGGDPAKVEKKHRVQAQPAAARLTAEADRRFFPALWERFEAETSGDAALTQLARKRFVHALVDVANDLIEEAADDVRCSTLWRQRAHVRAMQEFKRGLRRELAEYFAFDPVAPDPDAAEEDSSHAA